MICFKNYLNNLKDMISMLILQGCAWLKENTKWHKILPPGKNNWSIH